MNKAVLARLCRKMTRVGCCLLVVLPLSASALDLVGALDRAMQHDAAYQAARYQFEGTLEARIQARASLLPNVYYQYQTKKTEQDINEAQNAVFDNTSSSFRTTTSGFTVTQTLFNYEQFQRYSQAKVTASRAEAEFEAARQELYMRVAEAYFLVLERMDQLATVQAEKQAMETHLQLAERKVARGLSRSVDADDARARFLNALSKEIELKSFLMDARYALRESIGELPENLLPLKPDVALEEPQPNNPQQWLELAEKNNPMLHAARLALREASKEITLLKGRHYPTLELIYSDTNQDAGGSLYDGSSDVDTADLTLQLRVPLYSGGGVASRVRQATKAKYRSEEELTAREREVERNTVDAWRRIGAAIAQIEALEQSVAAQEKMMEIKRRGYSAGRYHILEVLDAQQDLSNARQSLTKARYDYALNTLRLKYESGALTEQDVRIVNGWLQGNAPYVPPVPQVVAQPQEELKAKPLSAEQESGPVSEDVSPDQEVVTEESSSGQQVGPEAQQDSEAEAAPDATDAPASDAGGADAAD